MRLTLCVYTIYRKQIMVIELRGGQSTRTFISVISIEIAAEQITMNAF